jgi:hypothetical protein
MKISFEVFFKIQWGAVVLVEGCFDCVVIMPLFWGPASHLYLIERNFTFDLLALSSQVPPIPAVPGFQEPTIHLVV